MMQIVYLIPGQGALVSIQMPGISAPVFSEVDSSTSILSADRRNCVFSAHPLSTPGDNILICRLAGKEKDPGHDILDVVLNGAVKTVTAEIWKELQSMLACGADPSTISMFLKKEEDQNGFLGDFK